MVDRTQWIWHDGEWQRWDDANTHLLTHSLHYGLAAFEGIRCYPIASGEAAIFRLREHLDRLAQTAHICQLDMPHSVEKLVEVCKEVVLRNELMDGCYLRPLVYMGSGAMGIAASNPVHVAVMAWRWGAYLGEEGVKNGIRAKVSSFRRPRGDVLLSKGKITGHYVNSILAKREALGSGFQEAILLDSYGYVCEGSGENIFVVQDNVVRTPSLGQAILAGITRDTAITSLRAKGYTIKEEIIAREELYLADEVFFTGTAAEITPVRDVDGRRVGSGSPGPITRWLQEEYASLVRGRTDDTRGWLTRVKAS